jgi:hypothetical protein
MPNFFGPYPFVASFAISAVNGSIVELPLDFFIENACREWGKGHKWYSYPL